jgi:hypothetical protein
MNQSFVKMMSRIAEVENYILKGLVLDEHGQWIPIADKRAVEEDFLAHLTAGQVLHEGRWVSIAEAKAARTPTEIATAVVEVGAGQEKTEVPAAVTGETQTVPQDEAAPAVQAVESPEETRNIQITPPSPEEETRTSPAPPRIPLAPVEGVDFPPETKSITIQQHAVDPESGFAPETGFFVVDQADGAARPEQDGSGAAAEAPALPPQAPEKALSSVMPPSLSTWEKDAQKSRKRIIIAGSIVAGLAGLAALAVILFQVAR